MCLENKGFDQRCAINLPVAPMGLYYSGRGITTFIRKKQNTMQQSIIGYIKYDDPCEQPDALLKNKKKTWYVWLSFLKSAFMTFVF